jgi:hypothetical protein
MLAVVHCGAGDDRIVDGWEIMSKTRFPMPRGSKQILAGIQWMVQYNCYQAEGLNIPIKFAWKEDGYQITVAGRTLKHKPTTPQQAAELGKRFAIEVLREDLNNLGVL